MKRLITLSLALIPSIVLALDFTDATDRYSDAPFSKADTAGISVLTDLGAVSGNPDGTFAPQRPVNRAEFLKIAFLSHPEIEPNASDEDDCFPDVKAVDWFSRYVCLAKDRGDVGGYPDGLFRPANTVNYAEALKMLSELYEYDLPEPADNERWAWYTAYVRAAEEHGVQLPSSVEPADLLTRAQTARLAAAYRADDEGELDEYRAFERGETMSSASSSSSSSSSSVSSASSSSVSSSSSRSSSVASAALFPAIGRFLVAGTQQTGVLADGTVTAAEQATFTVVEVELRREINGIEELYLIDGSNVRIATLRLQTNSNPDDTKWRADVATGGYVFPKDVPVRVGLRAKMKATGAGGSSNELFEMRTFSIRAIGTTTAQSYQLIPVDTHYPMHQTSFGRITSVENTLGSALSVQEGASRTLGTFRVSAFASTGANVTVESLSFELQTADVTLSNLRIGGTSLVQQSDCARETSDGRTILLCMIPEMMASVGGSPVTYTVYGDAVVGSGKQTGTVHLVARASGGVGSGGGVRWSDGSADFTWIEGDAHVESGPVVTVTK